MLKMRLMPPDLIRGSQLMSINLYEDAGFTGNTLSRCELSNRTSVDVALRLA
jgi:hypothetical protein